MQHTGDGRQAESTACTCLQHLDNRRSGTIVPESGKAVTVSLVWWLHASPTPFTSESGRSRVSRAVGTLV